MVMTPSDFDGSAGVLREAGTAAGVGWATGAGWAAGCSCFAWDIFSCAQATSAAAAHSHTNFHCV